MVEVLSPSPVLVNATPAVAPQVGISPGNLEAARSFSSIDFAGGSYHSSEVASEPVTLPSVGDATDFSGGVKSNLENPFDLPLAEAPEVIHYDFASDPLTKSEPQLPSPSEAVSIVENFLEESFKVKIRNASKEELDQMRENVSIAEVKAPEFEAKVEKAGEKVIQTEIEEVKPDVPLEKRELEADLVLAKEVIASLEAIYVPEPEKMVEEIIVEKHGQNLAKVKIDSEPPIEGFAYHQLTKESKDAKANGPGGKNPDVYSVDHDALSERLIAYEEAIKVAVSNSEDAMVSGKDVVAAYKGETVEQKSEILDPTSYDGSNGESAVEMVNNIEPSKDITLLQQKVIGIINSNLPVKKGEGEPVSQSNIDLIYNGPKVPNLQSVVVYQGG